MVRAAITSVGKFLPEKILTNKDLEKIVDTSDEWIVQRTGIRTRHVLEPGMGNSYMSVRAARDCLDRVGIDPLELDAIIIGTISPDMMFPSTACLVQKIIGADNAWGFDLSAGCSGFLYSMIMGSQLIETGRHKKVLAIGSDVNTSIVDYEDRNTCIIFGDGAGAVLLEPSTDPEYGIIDFEHHIDGMGGPYLNLKAGGSRQPASPETINKKEHFIYQDGKTVYKYAIKHMADVAISVMERNNIKGKEIDLFVPHQANARIIDACARRMGISSDKIIINIDKYGNTTAGTIPLCLCDAVEQRRLKKGDKVIIAAFGAGFTWGSAYVRWSMDV